MKLTRRSFVSVIGLVALALAGCAQGAPSPQSDSSSSMQSSAHDHSAMDPNGTHTVTDHTDTAVEVPNTIKRVAFEQIPLVATYVAHFDGEAPGIVATSKHLVNKMDDTMLAEIAPEALNVDTSFDNQGEINAETLLGLDPDIVFNNAYNAKSRETLEAAGLKVVGFDTVGAPTDTYVRWLRLLEDVFNEPGKNDAKIAYGEKLIGDAKARTAKVADSDKRTVAIVMRAAQGQLVLAGGMPQWFTQGWANTLNFTNVTEGTEGGPVPVNAEQLLEWDPDVILVAGKGMSSMTAAEILNNTVEDMDLSQLKAVKNRAVYTSELGMWNWFTPGPDAPVVANWLGAALYPEQFADVDLVSMTQDYYKQMYGADVSAERAKKIVDPDADIR